MNTMQIKCFLSVVETLNFTKAAESCLFHNRVSAGKLFSLERELNTLLFIRDKHSVRLTRRSSAGEELELFESRLEEVVHKVQKVGQGFSGSLVLGMLGGQFVGKNSRIKSWVLCQKTPISIWF